MPYNRFSRRSRFGRRRASAVPVTRSDVPMPKTKSRRKCNACGVHLEVGEAVVRLRLKKRFQQPCSVCSHKPAKLKFFHVACCPTDINKCMGYDPNAGHANAPTACAPPPKPMSALDASFAALVGFENALKRRIAENPALIKDKEFEASFKKYQGCKAHALRQNNDAEAGVALKMALKRSLDLIF